MHAPITLDIPHKLGRAAARERIARGANQLAAVVPGGSIRESRWDGDRLSFVVEAMGQRVAARIDVLDSRVHAVFDVPPMIALLAGTIRTQVQRLGTKLLA